LKTKTGKEVTDAMSEILHYRSPKLLQLENGKEFYNKTFDELMVKYNIQEKNVLRVYSARFTWVDFYFTEVASKI